MLSALLLAFSFPGFIKGLFMFLFVAVALLLTFVILLQEPKGGGLASAFGGAGAESFGVKTGGVNRFTAYMSVTFMVLAILYAALPQPEELAPSDLGVGAGVESSEEPAPPTDAPATPATPVPENSGGVDTGGGDSGGGDSGGGDPAGGESGG